MASMRTIIRKGSTFIATAVLGVLMPLGSLSADTSSTCTPPTYSTPGVHEPTGSDAVSYTYVCDPSSPYYGEWINAYYVFNPNTDVTTPINPEYHYDCTTGIWYQTVWNYAPTTGQYITGQEVVSAPSGQSTDCPVSTPANASPLNSPATSSDPTSSASGISNTGPNSANNSNVSGTNNLGLNNVLNATVTNSLTGVATSGNALVLANTLGGSATSGNAQDMQ